MKEEIKLANAHVNQHTSNGVRSDWKIEENKTDLPLGELPGRLNEQEVFGILNFARKFELEAFNIGITFGKQKYKETFESTINDYNNKLKLAAKENERLADALDRLTRLAN